MAANAPVINPQDSALQMKVKVEIRINPKTEVFARDIKIGVKNFVVTLEGKVPTEMDARNAERVALGVTGVANVINKLAVGA